MKNLLFILIVLISINTYAFGTQDYKQLQIYNELDVSNRQHQDICRLLRTNFKNDNLFEEYIKNRCTNFNGEKYKLQSTIYRFPNKSVPNYNKNHNKLLTTFTINSNKNEVTYLKNIVTEYCKYNSYLHNKKNPTACSQETLDNIFQTMP